MQLNPTHYNNKAEKVKWLRYLHRQSEDTPTKQACNEVTEKPTKKTKGGQKLTWH